MEVGYQSIDDLEAIARRDENRRLTSADLRNALMTGGRFERTQAGGAHRHHAPAARAGAGNRVGGRRRNRV